MNLALWGLNWIFISCLGLFVFLILICIPLLCFDLDLCLCKILVYLLVFTFSVQSIYDTYWVYLILILHSASIFLMQVQAQSPPSIIELEVASFWRQRWPEGVLDHCPSPSPFYGSSFAIWDKSILMDITFCLLLGLVLIINGYVLLTSLFWEESYLYVHTLVSPCIYCC